MGLSSRLAFLHINLFKYRLFYDILYYFMLFYVIFNYILSILFNFNLKYAYFFIKNPVNSDIFI